MNALSRESFEADTDLRMIRLVTARAPGIETSWTDTSSFTFYQRRGKRLLDIVLGTVLLLVLLPVMATVALGVLATSGWPIFYRHQRLGRDGHPFRMLKFRTMATNADRYLPRLLTRDPTLASEYRERLKLEHDPRRTKVGILLRKLSLDELPQFWHVIKGEMSLVGPRPYAVRERALLTEHVEILSQAPAITGPWQVGGRNALSPERRIALDAEYVSNVSLRQDLGYLLATVRCLTCANGR
jgi:exopolysaccharide production protein ExoY